VEYEEQLTAGLALLHQRASLLELPDLRLVARAHDRGGQLAFECALDRGDERLRVAVAPRGVLTECMAIPVLEVGKADLGAELAVDVGDPVPGELARAENFE